MTEIVHDRSTVLYITFIRNKVKTLKNVICFIKEL